ncbi:hypothetical protein Leryth_019643 [Lithospermum erythrorhizon]|nr:hypothetical protein Leryth_019643 [Lithospermum erythrorhizon]
MGCSSSKVDDLPAVALCRERCRFLDEAVHLRYALAEAHLAYLHSLKSVGVSLHRFFDQDLESLSVPDVIHTQERVISPRKPDIEKALKGGGGGALHHRRLNSDDGSHLHFHSDEDSDEDGEGDSDDDGDGFLHHHHDHDHSGSSSPLHGHQNVEHIQYGYGAPEEGLGYGFGNGVGDGFGAVNGGGGFVGGGGGGGFIGGGGGGGYVHMNYMKKQSMPSVVYQQKPVQQEVVHMGESSSSGIGGGDVGVGGSYVHMNYMRNQTTPSVVYQQKPMQQEVLHMGESSSSGGGGGAYQPYSAYPNYQNPRDYSLYGGGGYGYSEFSGGFSGSSQTVMPYVGPGPSSGASTSKPPPPPPSPPRASAWEFLNPFESFEKYYPTYPSSRDSRELREEEGIPDLEEEEDYAHEVVKEVHGTEKFVDVKGGAGGSYPKKVVPEDDHGKGIDVDALHTSRPSSSVDSDPMEYEVHMVDKKVVNDDKRAGDHVNVGRGAFKDDADVMKEIQVQFDHAAESGNDLALILEVGKLPYNRKHSAYQVSSKMLHAITPSLPSTSRSAEVEKADPASLDVDQELGFRSKSLSSLLHKLYLWEKKLYEEVKVEEKMRVLHERKSKKLKHLDERGADFNKVDATRALVRSLSTKIRIAIQVVDKISVKINKLRDEDFWPLLNETIQGLSKMWKSMLESHHNQCRAITEAKRLDAIALRKHLSDAHLEATLQLEHELLNWVLRFSSWVSAQKGFIRALDNWLMKCLLYVPEETADGTVPFSPGRMGAPPVFGVCHQWSQSLDRVSEKEVLDYMRDFATNVLHLWDRDKLEMRQRMTNDKDMDRRVKNLDREDQKIQKEIQALDKRMILVSGNDSGFAVTGQVVYQSDATKGGSLQVGLQRIFEAMEKFSGNSLKVYEELLQRIEDETGAENIDS